MNINIEIKSLTTELENACLSEWERLGASNSVLEQIKSFQCAEKIECFLVVYEEENLAIFEIRDAIEYIKNLKIFFSPKIDKIPDGDSVESAANNLDIQIAILGKIYQHLINSANAVGKLKINIGNGFDGTFFVLMSEALKHKFSEIYDIIVYRNWVEVINKEKK